MRIHYKACLLAGTLLAVHSPSTQAQTQHNDTNTNGHALHITNTDEVPTCHSQNMAGHAHHRNAAPLDVMGDHTHAQGQWMISYRYQRMFMEGNLQGDSTISPADIVTSVTNPNAPPATLRVVPLEMTMDMHMFGAMYGVTDRLTIMGMAMYMKNNMEHLTYSGMMGTTERGRFTTRSSGWGDSSLSAIYKLYETPNHTINAGLGVSVPTGSIKESDIVLTPMGTTPTLRLPYAMQLGSGTWDALPSLTYSGHAAQWFWGGQYTATLRLESENDQGYRRGHIHTLKGWAGYNVTSEWSVASHLSATHEGKIKGQDPNITAPVQTANPDNYGGDTLSGGIGLRYRPSYKPLKGLELGMDIALPVYQKANGTQMKRDWHATLALKYSF